jgi:LuxR family transcriptional regulator, maltose regulon positive regulatory protein
MALAKTTRPHLTGVVTCRRLFRVLDRYADRPLTWVTGPPGSGKTTLVGSYLQRRRRRTLWYQVDEGDRDAATFFYYLGRAAPGPRPLPLLTPEYQADLRTFARRFFRDLFARLGPRFALVLDNHQDVGPDARLNDALTTAVDEVPRGGRVFVLSRARPSSALSRFHATRELGVVDWPELRLTPPEARALARRLGPRSFRRATLRALVAAAEGWAAGLVLLLRAPDPTARGPIGSPASVREALFDYFADEVFRASDRVSQSVLLEVAFLPMLSASMAAALTGRADAGRTLDALARRHYFVQRLEADTPLYRLHPLFQAFLVARARTTLPLRRLRAVQILAARLVAEAGRPDDAAGLLVEAQDWDGLCDLIRTHAAAHITHGRAQTLDRWLAQLPPERVDREAWLLYWQGMCRQPFNPGEGRRLFERALTLFRQEQDASGTFLAWAAAVDTFLHEGHDFTPLDGWIAIFDEISRDVPTYPSAAIETRVVISMTGALIWRQPNHPEIFSWLARLQALAAASSDPDLHILAKHVWWLHIGTHGNWARVGPVAEELRVLAEREDASPMMRLMALFTVTRCQSMTAAFDRCRQTIARALELARTTGLRLWTPQFLGDRVAAELAEGKLEAAGRTLEVMAGEVTGSRRLDQKFHEYLTPGMRWRPGTSPARRRTLRGPAGSGRPSSRELSAPWQPTWRTRVARTRLPGPTWRGSSSWLVTTGWCTPHSWPGSRPRRSSSITATRTPGSGRCVRRCKWPGQSITSITGRGGHASWPASASKHWRRESRSTTSGS